MLRPFSPPQSSISGCIQSPRRRRACGRRACRSATTVEGERMNGDRLDGRILEKLFDVIESRRGSDAATSYTARLFAKGRTRIAKKTGEEAVEVVVAALAEGRQELAAESADLLYHLLVLWAAAGIEPGDVWTQLAKREGVSGLAEKAARQSSAQG